MDIRSQITQTNFKHALVECMKKKPFIQLKVKDIIKVSGMSSRTFYQYYKDTFDLLNSLEDDIYQDFQTALKRDTKAVANLTEIKPPLPQNDLVKVAEGVSKYSINFFIKNQENLELLTSDHGDIKFLNTLIEMANKEFALRMKSLNPHYKEILAKEQAIPANEVLQIFDNNIINIVLQLIRYNDELSPAEMRRYIASYLTSTPLEFLGFLPKNLK